MKHYCCEWLLRELQKIGSHSYSYKSQWQLLIACYHHSDILRYLSLVIKTFRFSERVKLLFNLKFFLLEMVWESTQSSSFKIQLIHIKCCMTSHFINLPYIYIDWKYCIITFSTIFPLTFLLCSQTPILKQE